VTSESKIRPVGVENGYFNAAGGRDPGVRVRNEPACVVPAGREYCGIIDQEADQNSGRMTMSATFDTGLTRIEVRPLYLAAIAGLGLAFVIGKALPSTMDAISAAIEPLCASSDPAGSALDTVEPIGSYVLPNVPGKRVTIVRVFYGPGGFTRAHRHAGSVTAYITKGEIRSQLGGGPVETFKVGQSFFEPPGATHLVSANASNTEPAELIAVFVADEGAQLTTFIE
jgi:quercetin dioxygenase-like cupin family protein